jgi:hypothetical protein
MKFDNKISHLRFSRSGVGATDVLQRNDIRQIVDLPGVGEHYMGKIQYFF